jgi:diaminohydroxyphosphoribosylaminopyrimidine deaminase/5-amino-6-(5-phosphoribosylamino)uracil reductase
VVVALQDPNPQVAGSGIAALRSAGIEVEIGEGANQVEADLAGFLLRMRRGYGRITLKIAMSLDGRTATASGGKSVDHGRGGSAGCAASSAQNLTLMVTGVGTVLADDCRLTLRADELPLDGDA